VTQASTIRVIEQSPGHLVLYEPPYWPFAIAFLAAALVIAVGLYLFMWSMNVRTAMRFAGCVLALPFLFFGLKALTSRTLVELSMQDRTVRLQHAQFFISSAPRIIPLDDVVRAVEVHARRSYAAALLLRSGEHVLLTGYGDQLGKPGIIAAINEFLSMPR